MIKYYLITQMIILVTYGIILIIIRIGGENDGLKEQISVLFKSFIPVIRIMILLMMWIALLNLLKEMLNSNE